MSRGQYFTEVFRVVLTGNHLSTVFNKPSERVVFRRRGGGGKKKFRWRINFYYVTRFNDIVIFSTWTDQTIILVHNVSRWITVDDGNWNTFDLIKVYLFERISQIAEYRRKTFFFVYQLSIIFIKTCAKTLRKHVVTKNDNSIVVSQKVKGTIRFQRNCNKGTGKSPD